MAISDLSTFRILHFNDVYNIRSQDASAFDTVSYFASALNQVRSDWPQDDKGLVLFSGDIFSPSLDSVITWGCHMVPVIYVLGVDAAVPGNHEFDYDDASSAPLKAFTLYAQLRMNVLARADHENDPWVLSNMSDTREDVQPEDHLSKVFHRFKIFSKKTSNNTNIKVGVIGLVGDWRGSVSKFATNYPHIRLDNMVGSATALATSLRDQGCDIVIAITHSSLKEASHTASIAPDLQLAEALSVKANSPDEKDVIDLILGGHDHEYYIGNGIGPQYCQGFVPAASRLKPAEAGNTYPARIIKSGTDFHEFSDVTLELERDPSAINRKTMIKSVKVKRIEPPRPCPRMRKVYDKIVGLVGQEDRVPLCLAENAWDLDDVRFKETRFGNWLTDETLTFFQERFPAKGVQAVFLASGCLRGKTILQSTEIAVSHIRQILLFPDPIVIIEVTGSDIWKAFEHGLDKPGRGAFPVFAGFIVKYKSQNALDQRVESLLLNATEVAKDDTKYKIATQTFLRSGGDGYTMFQNTTLVSEDSPVFLLDVAFGRLLRNSEERLQAVNARTVERIELAKPGNRPKHKDIYPDYRYLSATLPSWGKTSGRYSWDTAGSVLLSLGDQSSFGAPLPRQLMQPLPQPKASTRQLVQSPPQQYINSANIFRGYRSLYCNLDASAKGLVNAGDEGIGAHPPKGTKASPEEDKKTPEGGGAGPVPFKLPEVPNGDRRRLIDLTPPN
ncbi:hypothetical protein BOTBODRAFT_145676 [Botryobasidium botryosum FD-172 SS1]|uniref:Calcineurin-like phosphoesterase domain-containing protein n=1 Tax=Botryobasidium botryosum (strain FD-172 SS1) TaxID=930990 RepID=A0A067MFC6_BOTB1|nr:hypothetical protein BOTBODRAFT_145676 [Botryobasidium botryosum FD-172 SS1]